MIRFLSVFVFFFFQVAESQGGERLESKILYFVKTSEPNMVQIELNDEDKSLPLGGILHSFRIYKGLKIPTGEVKLVHVDKNKALALVVEDGTPYAKSLDSAYPGVMAGDGVEKPKDVIIPTPQVTPILEFQFAALFVDPSDKPQTYEIHEAGRALLAEKLATIKTMRFRRVLVHGFTDDLNSHEENQVESYQRALTVAQFMSKVMGFNMERIVPLGLGEDDLKDDSQTPGAKERNRRIIVTIEP